MADERQRQLERSMASCDTDEEREALARERCRASLHTWSDWETLGRWVMFSESMGRRQAIDLGYVQREVRQRVCWWCFQVEHKRVSAEELAQEAGRNPAQLDPEVARQNQERYGEPMPDSMSEALRIARESALPFLQVARVQGALMRRDLSGAEISAALEQMAQLANRGMLDVDQYLLALDRSPRVAGTLDSQEFQRLLCEHGRVAYHCGDCANRAAQEPERCTSCLADGRQCHLLHPHEGDHAWELPF